jgi:hypothetical protein
MAICNIEDCEKECPGTTRGMCWMHYYRVRRHGDSGTLLINPRGVSLEDRFRTIGWTVTETGCWEWNGARQSGGYGQLRDNGKTVYAHRLAYELHAGESVGHRVVRHSCDNRPCVNPAHLELGSRQDNMDDMKARGRHRYGPNAPHVTGETYATKSLNKAIHRSGRIDP